MCPSKTASPPTGLVDVAVPMPVYGTYTYRVPESFGSVAAGMRVLVPFGRRKVSGYVLGPAGPLPGDTPIKSVIAVLDDAPVFPGAMIPFFRWVAAYYIHPIGEVIHAALPGGLTVAEQSVYDLSNAGRDRLADPGLDTAARKLFQLLEQSSGSYAWLRKAGGRDIPRSKLDAWMDKGWIVKRSVLRGGRTRPKTRRFVVSLPIEPDKVRLSPQRQKILELIRTKGPQAMDDLKRLMPTAANLIRAMVRDNQAAVEERVVYRDPLGAPITPDRAPALTAEQQRAVQSMGRAFGQGFRTFLLAGVTGSGKTEVYLHLAADAMQRGLAVLVLVPEIALISQMERAFRARFGDRIALLHSGLSAGERYDQWLRIARGEIGIAIGARSAIFAPFVRLGLIIVDEEHDDSYKQEGSLRYSARDLAVVRARMDKALAVLGSATPSMQSAFNVQTGKYAQVTLLERVDRRTLPDIVVQDLTQIKEERGLRRFLTSTLLEAMRATLLRGEQVLLFLNRRGFASVLVCAACGQPLRCDRCDISLTYHQQINAYACHYCGFSRPAASCCNRCGSSKIKRLGLGTEKLESEIQKLFPQAKVARMDRDTTRRKGEIVKILKSLRDRRIDILVGTQMVAKGHDYPHITLVGIICADLSLSLPDFRAGERTFQLLAQVAGRAGRGQSPGQVILQTYNPGHFSIEAARNQDYGAFYRQEIEFRKALGYPPFSRMIQIRISGKDQGRTKEVAERLGDLGRQLRQSDAAFGALDMMGPMAAPLARIASQYRWQLLVKGGRANILHRFVKTLLFSPQAPAKRPDVSVAVDVDPLFLM
jgi:primosomal protein N' (replication factor Y) (superfamily II helicase)